MTAGSRCGSASRNADSSRCATHVVHSDQPRPCQLTSTKRTVSQSLTRTRQEKRRAAYGRRAARDPTEGRRHRVAAPSNPQAPAQRRGFFMSWWLSGVSVVDVSRTRPPRSTARPRRFPRCAVWWRQYARRKTLHPRRRRGDAEARGVLGAVEADLLQDRGRALGRSQLLRDAERAR